MEILHRNHFKDTVSVQEMKEAFHKFKDAQVSETSVYAGFDSVTSGLHIGPCVVLKSPLREYDGLRKEEFRAVWSWNKCFKLQQLLDGNGKPQEKLMAKLEKAGPKEWLNGEFLALCAPLPYMGFVVSPFPYMEVYHKGEVVALATPAPGRADFFTQAQQTRMVMDGQWYSCINEGARLLGLLVAQRSSANMNLPDKSFSVLLYETEDVKDPRNPYDLELLSPTNPDEGTKQLFEAMQRFVKLIPRGAFKPYYTTDFRILPGRYYRVTTDKCGWLVEDYLR